LPLANVADILSSCVALLQRQDDVVVHGGILKHISYSIQHDHNPSPYTVADIARILWTLQRLHHRTTDSIENTASLVRKFIRLVEEADATTSDTNNAATSTLDPKHLIMILRSVIIQSSGTTEIIHDVYHAIVPIASKASFLSRCNEFEISSLIWFLAKAHIYDKELVYSLSNRMREADVVDNCHPSSATRFLWSFTTLVEMNEEDLVIKEVLFETFQALGSVMYSSQLNRVGDISSTMWAMAKASYSLDMGIFDHLAQTLARDGMLERATTRQISQALWACGKMIAWENPLRTTANKNNGGGGGYGVAAGGGGEFMMNFPLYIDSGRKFASYLVTSSKLDQMSPKDIAQSCWALGHLRVNDAKIIYPLARTAASLAQNDAFNSQEIANIVWGLSKTYFRDEWLIRTLTRQLQRPSLKETCTPQEASNILYALGIMELRDEATFECMNDVIMTRLSDATAQTIANSFWAHDRVQIQPPQQLLDRWLRERLDVVDLYLDNEKQFHVIE